MARKCKLQDTKEWSTTDKAYKAPNGKYYSSKEIWEKIATNNEYRTKCIDFLMDLLGYQPKMKLPTITYKKIKEYEEPFGLDVLYNTMLSQEQACRWALQNKDFKMETAKIFYLFAIFQNNAMTEWQKKVAEQRSKEVSERQAGQMPDDLSLEYIPQKKRDIGRFLC